MRLFWTGVPKTASWLPKTALKSGSKTAASSSDSESRFSGLLEPLWVLRPQMCSLRSLQNECIVFVPPGACIVGSVVWAGCFGLVFPEWVVLACHLLLGFQDHIIAWCGLRCSGSTFGCCMLRINCWSMPSLCSEMTVIKYCNPHWHIENIIYK